jgi:hypothetical protein
MPLVSHLQLFIGHRHNLLELVPHLPIEQYRAAVEVNQDELGLGVVALEVGVEEVVEDGSEVEVGVRGVDAN